MSTDGAMVFVSWSGEWGHRLAKAVGEWIGLLGASHWTSAEITPGGEWLEELNEKIKASRAAIICVTPEALRSPWVNYEIGALSGLMRERNAAERNAAEPQHVAGAQWLFPLLFGVDPGQLSGPLAAVQSTRADDPTSVQRLASRISMACTPTCTPQKLSHDEAWDAFVRLRHRVPPLALAEAYPGFAPLFRRKTFDEATAECVAQQWLARYDGARETWRELREREEVVARCCRPYVVDTYKRLVMEVDKYAMSISKLIGTHSFPIDDEKGTLVIHPPGLALACERGRTAVKRLVARLLDSTGPVFEEAVCFQAADSSGERANLIANRRLEVEALVNQAPESTTATVKADGSRLALQKPEWLDLTPEYVTFGWIRDQWAGVSDENGTAPRPLETTRPVPTVEKRWRRSAWVYDRVLFAVFLTRRIQIAVQDRRPIDPWTVTTACDQLCLEIEDPCRGCGMVAEPDANSRVALEHAIRTLAVLAVAAPEAIGRIEQRGRLRVGLGLARKAFSDMTCHEGNEARTMLDLVEGVLDDKAPHEKAAGAVRIGESPCSGDVPATHGLS
jgi:hypothetical protein